MQSGMSYPSATEKAIGKFLDNSFGKRIFSPNDLLGVEYISAVIKLKANAPRHGKAPFNRTFGRKTRRKFRVGKRNPQNDF